MITVNEIYNKSKLDDVMLLSAYRGDFWDVYRQNNDRFDRYFKTKYKTFVIREQEKGDDVDDVLSLFTTLVYDFLMVNAKRYSELYRIQVVPDDESYSIVENYFLSETYTGNTDNQGTSASGQRTDVTNFEQGNQKQTSANSVSAFNSNALNNKDKNESEVGTRNDKNQYTQGAQEFTNHSTNIDNHTMVRHGAIGTQNADNIMSDHLKLWGDLFNFYDLIFDEIATHLLKVGE